jgi:GTP-binding protein
VFREVPILQNTKDKDDLSSVTEHTDDGEHEFSTVTRVIHLAVMGSPNVGKSSLLNRILGSDRLITDSLRGVTRESIPVEWEYKGYKFNLVDTAGLKRVRISERVASTLEDKSTQSSLNALRFANVVLLVLEVGPGQFRSMELQIIRKCVEEGRALIIVANKADVAMTSILEYEKSVKEHVKQLVHDTGHVPVVACSALTGNNVQRILPLVIQSHAAWSKRVPTPHLNDWLKDTLATYPAPRMRGRPAKIKFIVQLKTRPPSFMLFCTVPELPATYMRMLQHRLQKDFRFDGVPVRLRIRRQETRWDSKETRRAPSQSSAS